MTRFGTSVRYFILVISIVLVPLIGLAIWYGDLELAAKSSLMQALIGALFGGIGGFLASVYYAKQKKIQEETVRAITEFYSGSILIVRIGAYNETKEPEIQKRLKCDLSTLFRGTEDVKNLRHIFSYLESLGARVRAGVIDEKLARDTLGGHIKFWLEEFEYSIKSSPEKGSWGTTIQNILACERLKT